MQKFKVNGHSVPKIELKQTDGRTDRLTEAIAMPPSLMRSTTTVLNILTVQRYRPNESTCRKHYCAIVVERSFSQHTVYNRSTSSNFVERMNTAPAAQTRGYSTLRTLYSQRVTCGHSVSLAVQLAHALHISAVYTYTYPTWGDQNAGLENEGPWTAISSIYRVVQ